MGKQLQEHDRMDDGPLPYGCASVQDNLTTHPPLNGFTYRNDDFSETRMPQLIRLAPMPFP